MKELRAVVIGVLVIVLVAIALAVWRRPAREFRHVGGYRVEIQKMEGGARKHVSFTVPMALIARIASFVPMAKIKPFRTDWGDSDLTARDILDAADKSSPGQPGVIVRDRNRIEVTAQGLAIEILVKDEWGKSVRVRVPRLLIEGLSGEKRVSPRDILRRLDELGPGDVVSIKDGDDEVTITAQPR